MQDPSELYRFETDTDRSSARASVMLVSMGGFIALTPLVRLREFPRYVKAVAMRLDKFSISPTKDAQWQQEIQSWWQAWQARMAADAQRGVFEPRVDEFRWMLEELRVSLFAQSLGTAYPVSVKRVLRAIEAIDRV